MDLPLVGEYIVADMPVTGGDPKTYYGAIPLATLSLKPLRARHGVGSRCSRGSARYGDAYMITDRRTVFLPIQKA